MKQVLLIVCCLWATFATAVVQAQNSNSTTIVETSSHNIFTGFFKSVWARLKSLSPTIKESANSDVVYTAGIRGAESTDTLLKPYWKDDLTQNKEFQAELQKYSLAQLKMDRGELESAVKLFDSFLDEFAQSDLRPNALFGKSISLAGLGQNQQSLATMQQFVEENPNHPLSADARLVIEELE
jgi:tetratricopeptide (TPR) repeat protein